MTNRERLSENERDSFREGKTEGRDEYGQEMRRKKKVESKER